MLKLAAPRWVKEYRKGNITDKDLGKIWDAGYHKVRMLGYHRPDLYGKEILKLYSYEGLPFFAHNNINEPKVVADAIRKIMKEKNPEKMNSLKKIVLKNIGDMRQGDAYQDKLKAEMNKVIEMSREPGGSAKNSLRNVFKKMNPKYLAVGAGIPLLVAGGYIANREGLFDWFKDKQKDG